LAQDETGRRFHESANLAGRNSPIGGSGVDPRTPNRQHSISGQQDD